MSSLTRRIQRKWPRDNGVYKNAKQPTVFLPDGGYMTLRPTKGWLKVSGKRMKGKQDV